MRVYYRDTWNVSYRETSRNGMKKKMEATPIFRVQGSGQVQGSGALSE